MSLSILPDPDDYDTDDHAQPGSARIPDFEGNAVEFTKAKLTSVSGLEIGDAVLGLDDRVRMVIEGHVVRVDHVANERTGKLERVQVIKAVDAMLIPWDDSRAERRDA